MYTFFQSISSEGRRRILLDIADALEANEKLILTENGADVIAAQESGYEKSLISRLVLKPGKARASIFFLPECCYELILLPTLFSLRDYHYLT